jgi:hypothetical protein
VCARCGRQRGSRTQQKACERGACVGEGVAEEEPWTSKHDDGKGTRQQQPASPLSPQKCAPSCSSREPQLAGPSPARAAQPSCTGRVLQTRPRRLPHWPPQVHHQP